jgi:hypothetical protein
MNKLFPSAEEALHGVTRDGMLWLLVDSVCVAFQSGCLRRSVTAVCAI